MSSTLFFIIPLLIVYPFVCKYIYDMRIQGNRLEQDIKDEVYVKKINHTYKMVSIFISIFIVICTNFFKHILHIDTLFGAAFAVVWGYITIKIMVRIANKNINNKNKK